MPLSPAEASAQNAPPVCSPAITNPTCTIIIDRDLPSSPLPLKMATGATVSLLVRKRPLDGIVIDTTYADVATPDPLASVFSAFAPILKNVVYDTSIRTRGIPPGALAAAPFGSQQDVEAQLLWIETQQLEARDGFRQSLSARDRAVSRLKDFQDRAVGDWTREKFASEQRDLPAMLTEAANTAPQTGVVNGLHDVLSTVTRTYAGSSASATGFTRTAVDLLNEVSWNQVQLESSSKAFETAGAALLQAAGVIGKLDWNTALQFSPRPFGRNTSKGGRSASVKISAQDMLTKTTVPLATMTMSWTATRWESSVGPVFSWMRNRSFQNSPVIVNGQLQLDATGKVNTTITESDTRPSVMPFTFAHYRMGEMASGGARWAVLLTGGLGISPYSGSADLAAGVTVLYRSFMLTPLIHWGRDLRLADGLKPGQSLGSSPLSPLPTERFWTRTGGVAVTIRVF